VNPYSAVDRLPAGREPGALLTNLLRRAIYRHVGLRLLDHRVPQERARARRLLQGARAAALTPGIDIELPDILGYGVALLCEIAARWRCQSLIAVPPFLLVGRA